LPVCGPTIALASGRSAGARALGLDPSEPMIAAESHRLVRIDLDEGSLAPLSPEQDDERHVAIADLLIGNVFHPDGAANGPMA